MASSPGAWTPGTPACPPRTCGWTFPDPPHEWPSVRSEWNQGAMDGFVREYQRSQRRHTIQSSGAIALAGATPEESTTGIPHRVARSVMGYYTRNTLPVYYDLADQFTLCDNWFASFLGSTHPNRIYANAGFCGDALKTGTGTLFINKPAPVRDRWEDAGRGRADPFTWRWYQPESEMLTTFLLWFRFFTGHTGYRRAFHQFVADCKSGDLASVNILEPPFSFADDHPKHDPRRGQRFVALVLKALLANPEVWSQTALVIYYDEHGGFFDHVQPPTREVVAPPPFDRLGMRVPAMVVSPYARARHVAHAQFDHRSVLKSIAERWDLPLPTDLPHTDWSRIGSLWEECFDFSRPPIDPRTVRITDVQTDWLARFNAGGQLPQRTDLVEAFVEMAHLENLDGMRALMEEAYYQL